MKSILSEQNINSLKTKYKNDEKQIIKDLYDEFTSTIKPKILKKNYKFFDADSLDKLIDKFISWKKEKFKRKKPMNNDWIIFTTLFQDKLGLEPKEMYDMRDKLAEPYKEFKDVFLQPLSYIDEFIKKKILHKKGGKKEKNKKKEEDEEETDEETEDEINLIDEDECCPCEDFVISQSLQRPFVVDNENDVWSILEPEHKKSDHGPKEIKGKFQLCPNFNKERECILISGPSGAGKTYLATRYLTKYKKLNPKNPIYLFGTKPFDKKDFKEKYIKPLLNKENTKKLKVSDFKNCIMVFDDVENMSYDPDTQMNIQRFLEEVLNVGRSLAISMIIISHILMNYRFSRNMIMECNKVAMFPRSGARHQYENFLSKYVGLDKKQIQEALKTNSRWLVVDKECPISIMDKNRFKILTD